MPRRVSLPGAAELFRTTPAERTGDPVADEPVRDRASAAAGETDPPEPAEATRPRARAAGSGRVRHEEKITVYVSSDELLDLERARLSLRAEHKMAVDRGRIVRAALAMALGDLKDHGQQSELVRRLSEQ